MEDERQRAERHGRQLLLQDWGLEGQARLARARVLVVGCGGLGTPVVQAFAGAGVGHLTLADDDRVERSNLNRQVLHRSVDIGRNKAARAAEWVAELDAALSVRAHPHRLGVEDARSWVRTHDLVMDCTDGLPAKFLLNDACVREDIPLIHGAVTAWSGQVLRVPGGRGPCLRCLFEGVPPAGTVPTCQQAGVTAAACGLVGNLMALEGLKLLLGWSAGAAAYLGVDVREPALRPLQLARRADCPTCGDEPTIDARSPEDYVPAPAACHD